MKAYMNSITFDYATENYISDVTGLIEIDMGLVSVISVLNKKGYRTHSSSEGYVRKSLDNDTNELVIPHIVFDFDVSLPSTPEAWYASRHEIEGVKNWTRVKRSVVAIEATEVIVASTNIEFEIVKHIALANLAEWANNLPAVTPPIKA